MNREILKAGLALSQLTEQKLNLEIEDIRRKLEYMHRAPTLNRQEFKKLVPDIIPETHD